MSVTYARCLSQRAPNSSNILSCKMKTKSKKPSKNNLSDKIADALTLKPRADVEDDQVFGTKPQTVSRTDLSSSGSEDEAAISDFRKRNVNLLSEISKKYEGKVVSRRKLDEEQSDVKDDSDDDTLSDAESVINQSSYNVSSHVASDSDNSASQLPPSLLSVRQAMLSKTKKHQSDSEDNESYDDVESDDYSIIKPRTETKSDEESSEDDDGSEGIDISQMEEHAEDTFEHVKKQNVPEDVKKGNCVRNQLLIWEGLLEMRIYLQRCMNTANQMPLPDAFAELKESNDFAEECNATKLKVANVLDKFLSLQNMLLKNNPETKPLSSKKQEQKQKQEEKPESDEEIPSDTDNEEIPSDTEPENTDTETTPSKSKDTSHSNKTKKRKFTEYEKEIETSHKAFKTFRDSTIQKWNDKTKLATAANIKSAPTNSILQQITYILSDKHKLVKRTQLKRSEYEIVGYKSMAEVDTNKNENGTQINQVLRDRKDNDEYIPEIFDDTDFYHQLLRELIECKSADISDPVQLSRQWIALQQMRSKMKRKVDTKATKGRKIKYVVHNKLVNYMASEKSTTWTDESKNELYSSLFGKMFEHNNVGINLDNGFKINN